MAWCHDEIIFWRSMLVLQSLSDSRRQRRKVTINIPLNRIFQFDNLCNFPATHLNNGPTEPSPAPQQPQQQQATPVTLPNKRPAPSNPVSTIQVPPLENGLDYRGHHPLNSNQLQSATQSSVSQSSNIR